MRAALVAALVLVAACAGESAVEMTTSTLMIETTMSTTSTTTVVEVTTATEAAGPVDVCRRTLSHAQDRTDDWSCEVGAIGAVTRCQESRTVDSARVFR